MNLVEQLAQASAASPPKRVLGIDLGTTNSTVAQVQLPLDPAGTPELLCECISIEQMTPSGPFYGSLVPSVVAIDKSGKTWIGEGAKRMRSLPRDYGLSPEKNLFHDTKNEIGLRKRYYRAPEDYNHARKIAGHVLRFLAQGARKASGHAAARTVVTVPASFQLNQRADTLDAASLAGLSLTDYDLLDEPLAALTDYLFTFAEPEFMAKAANIVVFDFGGGTCDVFAARLKPRGAQAGVDIEAKAVSRYHRLGGSDFDAAIIHEVLIPALLKENNLPARHFEWGDRKRVLEPALRGCAEALKEGLCREIAQLHLHGRYQSADKTSIAAKQMATAVRVGDTEYLLAEPRLTAAKWEELLEPFLSTELLHVRQSDFCQTLSIFAPISDAMERARLPVADVHFVLMAGGSSLIPEVQWAVENYFPKSRVLTFPDSTAAQTAIARGAAWSAAWLEATGQPFVRPVISEAIALRVRGRDPITLVAAGSPIPFPADGSWASKAGLVLPKQFNGLLKVEIVTMPDEQIVLHMPVEMDKKHGGEPLLLQYRFTAARCFECALALQREPDKRTESSVENPLVNVANPGAARVEIEEIEEELRDAGALGKRHSRQLLRLASLYREVRMLEKAAEVLKSAARVAGEADPVILNIQAINYDEIGDFNRMESCYKEAVRVSPWSTPFFNWAIHCYRQKRYDAALEKLDEAIVREPTDGAYFVLKARILLATGNKEAATQSAEHGLSLFPPVQEQSDWQLAWFESAAFTLNRQAELKAVKDAAPPRRHPPRAPTAPPRSRTTPDKPNYMPFLLHDSQLTREQRSIVELRPDRHHLVLGPPGSGKTQVLLHRARWLRDRANTPPDRYRIFVFTNVLSQFIRQSLDYLGIPPGTVQTFDDWCGGLWETLIGGRKPKAPAPGKGLDYSAIRRGVAAALQKSPGGARLLDFAMVDEGQDLDGYAYQILRAAVPHVSVFADARQQIFESGLGEAEILAALGVAQQTAALLPAYRNSPDVAKLASYFGNQFDGLNYTAKDRQKPCFYVAADWDDEIDQMAIIIREQMRLNHKVCIIVPTNRDLYGVASRLGVRGVPVEKATPPRGGAPPADFNSLTPKIATYHSAKGLTFDCVILPKLVENNFQRVQGPRRHRLLLVGITRATQWVYLSTVRGYELKEVALLREAEAKGDLFVLSSAKPAAATSPPPAEEQVPEDSFL